MNTATIHNINEKGFGFLDVDGMDGTVFFHASKIRGVKFDELRKGDKVTFDELTTDDKGTRAIGIELVTE
jgi:CspA family cold shock protein